LCTLIFVSIADQSAVQEHRAAIKGSPIEEPIPLDRYRHKNEKRDLSFGFGAAILLILLSGSLAGITLLLVFFVTIAYTLVSMSTKIKSMTEVSETQFPKIYKAYKKAQENLPDAKVRVLVEDNSTMNAYTFGINEPYPVILHSALVEKMSPKELQAIIGHEMGHILLNHTFLTGLIAAPKNFIGKLLFLKWSRTAEYSCDAMAYVATGKNLKPVASALIRLSDAQVGDIDIESFLDSKGSLAKLLEAMPTFFSTHPSIYKRVLHLVKIDEQGGKTVNSVNSAAK
jgi:Zn-dependent protease with chaperone function